MCIVQIIVQRQNWEESYVHVCCQQIPVYGANVVIFEGIMAFVYPDVRDVSLCVIILL